MKISRKKAEECRTVILRDPLADLPTAREEAKRETRREPVRTERREVVRR